MAWTSGGLSNTAVTQKIGGGGDGGAAAIQLQQEKERAALERQRAEAAARDASAATQAAAAQRQQAVLSAMSGPSAPGAAGGGGSAAPTVTTGGGSPGIAAAGPLTLTAQSNPGIQSAVEAYRARTAQQQGREGTVDPNKQLQIDRIAGLMSQDQSERLKDQAGSSARDAGDLRKTEAKASLNARGLIGSGMQAREESMIGDAAARAGIKAKAGIDRDELLRKQNLTLAAQGIMEAPGAEAERRGNAVNAMYGQVPGMESINPELGLREKALGLQAWQAQTGAGQAETALGQSQQRINQQGQDSAFNNYLQLLRASGYA